VSLAIMEATDPD
jgi:alkylhydroperoxidase/carboxymuconolactone decarboxylase family protein YurZ